MKPRIAVTRLPARCFRRTRALTALALVTGGGGLVTACRVAHRDGWPVTGGAPANDRYSTLDQVNRDNVSQLTVAWTYHSGDMAPGRRSEIQATPIVVDSVLYTTTPALAVVALRADSGTLRWRFDPFEGRAREVHANRGVSYWADGNDRRILFTAGQRLYALDARTGRPIRTFGDSGWVDLSAGVVRDMPADSAESWSGFIVATSPGVVFEDLLIQGTRVAEDEGAAPGHVRAYDVRTGRVRWTFHTIPQHGEPGAETWPNDAWKTAGGANSWPGMSVDTRRGIVYVPTGSASPDFYGGGRRGANLYANTLLALDARTGRRIWHFQTVHHDLLDRDLPAAPNLVTVRHGGRSVDAVAQITKSGFVFLFDRENGRPLFPVEERPVPASDLNGEQSWPTQPVPTRPAPFARQTMTEADLTDLSPAAHESVLQRFRTLRNDGLFTPPSMKGSIVLPGFDGGGEWGGAAVDRENGVLYVNASDVPWIAAMRPMTLGALGGLTLGGGADVYSAFCAGCHRADRQGDGDRVPSLAGLGSRLSPAQAQAVISRGRGFMPAFRDLPEPERDAVVAYLFGRSAPIRPNVRAASVPSSASPYRFAGYERWKDPDGYPAIKPPWGTLSAIDLNTGEYRWRVPLGEFPSLTARGLPPTGTEVYGGPIVTAGGIVFIAATQDEKLRAFDKATGRLLWEAKLPAAGYATPSTYAVGGRQFVVIAAGGGKLGSKSSDTYVAFALRDMTLETSAKPR